MTTAAMTATASQPLDPPGGRYNHFLGQQRDRFTALAGAGPLFTTDAADLWPAFLAALPEHERQHHTCHACRHFVERYGNLVVIDENGRTTPVMWGEAEGLYAAPFAALRRLVGRAKITGVFLSPDPTWGIPKTGEWRHMAVTPPSSLVYRETALKTAGQAMAEKREEHGMLCRGLADFGADVVRQALTILEAEALYRSEKVIGPARWLADLHEKRAAARSKAARENVTWLAVASAPMGFAHIRTTMIGTLLEDIAAGLPFDDVKRKFAAKMNPLQYQRPQAPPSAGNIAEAERIFETLGLAPALRRRFARLEEIVALWRPAPETPERPAGGGTFAHLTPKGAQPRAPSLAMPPVTMTWVKFRDTVLPTATAMEYRVPHGPGHYLAMVTAADPDAPPILQWDTPEKRNPVNWYVYPMGTVPSKWNLVAGGRAKVAAVSALPFLWDPERTFAHQGEGVVLVLDGCRDLTPCGGAALFPEVLKSELHAVRSTIEAHSRTAGIAGKDEASACGVDLRKGGNWHDCVIDVTSKTGVRTAYRLDRWD